MNITNCYILNMEPKVTPFSAALEHCIRTRKNITQTKIASSTGVHQSMVSGMKNGTRQGSEQGRRKIAFFLGYEYEEFLKFGRQILKIDKQQRDEVQNERGVIQNERGEIQIQKIKRHQELVGNFQNHHEAIELNRILLKIEKVAGDEGLILAKGALLSIVGQLDSGQEKTGTDNQGNS